MPGSLTMQRRSAGELLPVSSFSMLYFKISDTVQKMISTVKGF
jgi:hypothetical protein